MGGAFSKTSENLYKAGRPAWAQKLSPEAMRQKAPAPKELTGENLKYFYETADSMIAKKEMKNTMPDANSKEYAEVVQRYSKLQVGEIPAGRLNETELSEVLSWRAERTEPPVSALSAKVGPDARSLLVYFGTPQIVEDKKNATRAGFWTPMSHFDASQL